MTQKLKWEGFWSFHWLKFQLVHYDDTDYLTNGRGQAIRLDHMLTIESLLNILFLCHAWSDLELQLTLGLPVSEFLINPGIGCKISKRILWLLKYILFLLSYCICILWPSSMELHVLGIYDCIPCWVVVFCFYTRQGNSIFFLTADIHFTVRTLSLSLSLSLFVIWLKHWIW